MVEEQYPQEQDDEQPGLDLESFGCTLLLDAGYFHDPIRDSVCDLVEIGYD